MGTVPTLPDLLARSARWFPDAEAAVDSACRYTYAELQEKAERMAGLYHELGVRRGDRVAFLLFASPDHVVALFGALHLGALPVALHVRESPAVLAASLRRLSPRVLVYDDSLHPVVEALRTEVPGVTGYVRARSEFTGTDANAGSPDPLIPDCLGRYPSGRPRARVQETDAAIIVLSSGTTDLPKGIVHTHRTLMESARGGLYLWGARPSDAIVNTMTTSFIGWYNLCLPFLNVGAKNVFLSRFDPRRFLQTLQAEHATIAFLVPTMWRMLLREELPTYDLSRIRLVGFAGEVMDAKTLLRVKQAFSDNVINIYGTTETGSCSGGTIMFAEDMAREGKLSSVGKPHLNSDVRIITPGGEPDAEVPRGEIGEVIVSGPSVADDVWDDPEAARRIFRERWWYSGDLGRLDGDGYLFLEGRADDMIISGGINVLAVRFENVLMTHEGVSEVAVVGRPDEVYGQRVTAYVVAKGAEVTADALDAHVRASELSDYQRPRAYHFVTALPRTASGKLNRRALRTGAGE